MNKDFQLGPEDNLLIACARKDIDSATKKYISYLLNNDIDWCNFSTLVSKNSLTPIVYLNINKTDYGKVCKTFAEKSREYLNKNVQKNLLMWAELFKILEIFYSHGIPAIPYKGPVLTIFAYGNLALREFNDLDIFIPKQYFFQVEDLMINLGYKPVLRLKNEQKKLFLKFQREFKFINDKGIPVEIKWQFPVSTFYFREDPIMLCDHEESIFNNHIFKTLKLENLLLILCLHNAGHYWFKLRGICDIVEILDSHDINWSKCLLMAEELGIKRIFFINLFLANFLFGINLPNQILLYIDSDRSCKLIAKQIIESFFSTEKDELNLFRKIKMRIRIRERYNDKLRDLLNMIIVPTPSVLGSVSLPHYLIFAYPLLRIAQLIKTYVLKK